MTRTAPTRPSLILGIVFLLGILAGAGLAMGYGYWGGHHKKHRTEAAFVQHMSQYLQLTPGQTKQFQGILDQAIARFHELHTSCRQQFLAIRHQERQKVRAFLTPAQRARFNAWVAAKDRRQAQKRKP